MFRSSLHETTPMKNRPMARLRYPLPSSVDADIPRDQLKVVLRHLGRELGYACPEDWYTLTVEDLQRVRGLVDVVLNPIRAGRIVHPDLNPLLFEYRRRS
jgi:hypothetical protein